MFKMCELFMLPVNYWAFWWKPYSTAHGSKMMVH